MVQQGELPLPCHFLSILSLDDRRHDLHDWRCCRASRLLNWQLWYLPVSGLLIHPGERYCLLLADWLRLCLLVLGCTAECVNRRLDRCDLPWWLYLALLDARTSHWLDQRPRLGGNQRRGVWMGPSSQSVPGDRHGQADE
jgi:hypothetical protein